MNKKIIICRNNYVTVPVSTVLDRSLSIKNKGLLLTLLSFPDGQELSAAGIAKLSNGTGTATVRTGLKELEALGYLVRVPVTDAAGEITGINYRIFDKKQILDSEELL